MGEINRLDARTVCDLFAEYWSYRKFFAIVIVISICLGLLVASVNEKKYKVTTSVKVLDINVSAVIDGLIYDQPYETVNGSKYHPLMRVNPIDYFRLKKNLVEFSDNFHRSKGLSDHAGNMAGRDFIETMRVVVVNREVAVDRSFETILLKLSFYAGSEFIASHMLNEYIEFATKNFKQDMRKLVDEYLEEEKKYVNRQIDLLSRDAKRRKAAKIEYLKGHANLAKRSGYTETGKEIDDIALACLMGFSPCESSLPLYELGYGVIRDRLNQLMNENESHITPDILEIKKRKDYLNSMTPDFLSKLDIVEVIEPAYQVGNPATPNFALMLLIFCFSGVLLALIFINQLIRRG